VWRERVVELEEECLPESLAVGAAVEQESAQQELSAEALVLELQRVVRAVAKAQEFVQAQHQEPRERQRV